MLNVIPFSIFTATVEIPGRPGRSFASDFTTTPKAPSPNFPKNRNLSRHNSKYMNAIGEKIMHSMVGKF